MRLSARPAFAPLLFLLLLLPLPRAAAHAATGNGTDREPFVVRPATGPVSVDGRLDEAAWQDAAPIPLAWETWPADNGPAAVATTCRLTWDERTLYVGCRADEPEPATIRARYADRDDAFRDDYVGVQLDPFNDRRRAFAFYVNPLGVQMDLFLDDLGVSMFGGSGSEDPTWDAIWASAGRLTPAGYEVEMGIPFTSLRFPQGNGVQTWGLSFVRVRPRDFRYQLASQPKDRDRSCTVCQFSLVTGLTGLTPGHAIELDPTITAQRTDRRPEPASRGLAAGSVQTDLGLTATWGVTPNLILNAAINPDFSQIEADALQLDVNERFALFYPEKRPFFLEGADFFTTPFQAVFTRNVAAPDWGLKASGKIGVHALGAFVARDERSTLLLPGSQGSQNALLPGKTEDAALRYRRDVGHGSSLGLLATARQGDGYENRIGGLDGLIRLGASDLVRFQALGSRTEYPDGIVAAYGQPAGQFSGHALFGAYEHLSQRWRWSGRYEEVAPDFRADLGFMPQVDRRYGKALVERHWWAREGSWWTSARVGVDSSRTETRAGELLERLDEVWIMLDGVRELDLFVQVSDRTRTFAGRRFEESFIDGRFGLRPTGALSFGIYVMAGDEIDYAHARPGEQVRLQPTLGLNVGRHLRAELSHSWQRLDVDPGRLFTANLTELHLIWQFNVRTFVRAIAQRSLVERDPALYAFPVEARSDRLFSQLLFSYKLNPQTVFFLGYSETGFGTAEIDRRREERTLFVKLGYALSL